jgi:hypothetical protein
MNMAKTPATAETATRKRRAGPRGPRVATILCHVDPETGKPVVDLLTFSHNGLDILHKFNELRAAGVEPELVNYTMPYKAGEDDANVPSVDGQ